MKLQRKTAMSKRAGIKFGLGMLISSTANLLPSGWSILMEVFGLFLAFLGLRDDYEGK